MSMHDWSRIDAEVTGLLAAWRRGLTQLRRDASGAEEADNPLDSRWLDRDRIAELAELDDPLARALVTWLTVLWSASRSWDDRADIAAMWRAAHRVDHADAPLSLSALRDGMFSAATDAERQRHTAALLRLSGPLSDRTIAALERRFEDEQKLPDALRFGAVEGVERAQLGSICLRFLERSDELAETMRRGFVSGLHAALGRDASEGWPAKLTTRWIGDVFEGTGLTHGLRLGPVSLPRLWGATSFARALGGFGMAVLDAGRPAQLPRALHQHPAGSRRQVRYALFASIIAEPTFAQRMLGLSRGRADHQRRGIARAMLASLRVDALRVLALAALHEGRDRAHEQLAEVSARCFDQPLPAPFYGVVPRLRSGDGAAFVGALCAAEQRALLIDAYDEDWFRNPRAIEMLRDEDTRPLPADPTIGEARLSALLDATLAHFQRSVE